ncbi:hypothetical protein Esti_004809 [Eimeria stiedai]
MEGGLLRVSIPTFEQIDDGRAVAFQVSVQYAKLAWTVWRRFSDFIALHEQLQASDYAALPEPPAKTFLSPVTDAHFLEKRKNKLFNYLQELLRRPDTRMSEQLLNFLSLTEQAAVQSKCVRAVLAATTGPQRFSVSSMGLGFACQDNSSMSRLGRLWTIVEPDELGQISVWLLDASNRFFSSPYSRKLPNKARAVAYHARSNKVILGLDDGSLQSFELTSSGGLKQVGNADIHHSPLIGFSGLEQGGSKLLSAAADGSIRLTDVESFSVLSGGRLGKRLGSCVLSCCVYEEETKRAFLGTTAGVLLVYSLSAKKPDFEFECLLSPSEAIRCMQADSLGLFVGHGPSVSVLQQQRSRLERGALLQLRDNAEDVHALALDKPHRRLFAGYCTFIAWWSIDGGECLVAWTAHSGGVHQLLCQETGDTLISGGDSGTIKLWRLPPASALTSWGVQTPQEQFEGDECCMRPVEENAVSPYSDVVPDLQQQQQQREGLAASAAHGDLSSEAFGRGRHHVLLRHYSSDSGEDEGTQQHQQQQQQQQQQQEEPPLLLQQAEDSSDEELDDLRSALA